MPWPNTVAAHPHRPWNSGNFPHCFPALVSRCIDLCSCATAKPASDGLLIDVAARDFPWRAQEGEVGQNIRPMGRSSDVARGQMPYDICHFPPRT